MADLIFAIAGMLPMLLQKSNPEAFKNIVRRLLEAAGRGMWNTDEANLARLRDLYSDADDKIEEGSNST